MIVNNAVLVSLWPNEPVVEGALLAMEGRSVVDFGKVGKLVDRYEHPEVLDVSGRLVLPGLVDGHSILERALTLGAPGALSRERLEAALDPESLYWSAMVSLLDAVRSGVTTLFVLSPVGADAGTWLEASRRAFTEVGVRGTIAHFVSPEPECASKLRESFREPAGPDTSGGQRMRTLVGLRIREGLEDRTIRRALELSQEYETRFHFVLDEGSPPFAKRLERAGSLQRGGLVACRGPLAAEDEVVLRDHDIWAVHLPRAAVVDGFDSSDLRRSASTRVKLALGTAGLKGGIAEEFRFAALCERMRGRNLTDGIALAFRAAFHGNPDLATATLERETGRIKPGASADVVVFDYRPSTPVETANVAEQLFWGMTAAPVHSVIVNGRPLYQNHRFVALDEERIRARAREAARKLWKRL